MSDSDQWQTVVKAGLEGGGLTVSGRKRSDGTWALRLWTTSMTLDENDDEAWVETTRDISSLADAFAGAADYFGALVPDQSVHPEFRAEMLDIVERLAPAPGAFAHRAWTERNHARWIRACSSLVSDDV